MNETLISEFRRNEARDMAAEGLPLRPVLWSELTARLAAMRDLRHSLAGGSQWATANFSSFAAAEPHACSAFTEFAEPRAEQGPDGSRVNEGEPHINLEALADGKGPAPNSSVVPNCVTPGDRELK